MMLPVQLPLICVLLLMNWHTVTPLLKYQSEMSAYQAPCLPSTLLIAAVTLQEILLLSSFVILKHQSSPSILPTHPSNVMELEILLKLPTGLLLTEVPLLLMLANPPLNGLLITLVKVQPPVNLSWSPSLHLMNVDSVLLEP